MSFSQAGLKKTPRSIRARRFYLRERNLDAATVTVREAWPNGVDAREPPRHD
jgi:hypothetical protein